ncbi:MAG: hypothetical protein K2G39_11210, partial [Lachnospiraceae bacterium]|nr:hypothetical protein [Lachnospiraceae bacterium]
IVKERPLPFGKSAGYPWRAGEKYSPQIGKVERNLRCRLSNYFSVTYGVLGYKNPNNFSEITYHNFLNQLFEKYPHADKSTMGFTKDWKELLKD